MKLFNFVCIASCFVEFRYFVVIESLSVVDTRLWLNIDALALSYELRFQRSEHV